MKVNVIKENLLALWIAIVLAFSVMFMLSQTEFLKADILWVEEQEQEIRWDIFAYFESDNLKIVSNRSFNGVASIAFTTVFDPEKIQPSKEDIDSDYNFSNSISNESWSLNVTFLDIGKLEKGDKIGKINLWGEKSINIERARIKFTDDSETERLEITTR